MEAHSGDDGTVGHGVRGLSGSERIEGSQNADLATVVHGRVTEGKDFKFQLAEYGSCVPSGKASALRKVGPGPSLPGSATFRDRENRAPDGDWPARDDGSPPCRMLAHSAGGCGLRKNPLNAQGGGSLETLKRSKNPIKPTKPLRKLETDRVINDKNEEITGLVAAWLTM